MKIDVKKLEKSACDTYNVCALLGCLTRSIHDKIGDSLGTDEERLFWQLKGAIEISYNILDQASFTFFEVLEQIDQEEGENLSSNVKGQGEADTP